MTPSQQAAAIFALYAADLPPYNNAADVGVLSALQCWLSEWQSRNLGAATLEQLALGVAEESGELAHSILKHSQGIRGMDDREAFRAAAGDAIADCAVFLIQMCTLLRLDFQELVHATADQVMGRNWKKED